MLMRVAALALVPRVIRALSRKPQAEARLPAPAEVEQPLEKPEPVVTSPAKVQKTPARRWTITRSVKRESAILCGWWAPTGTRGPPSHFGGSRSWAYLHRRSFPINRVDPEGLDDMSRVIRDSSSYGLPNHGNPGLQNPWNPTDTQSLNNGIDVVRSVDPGKASILQGRLRRGEIRPLNPAVTGWAEGFTPGDTMALDAKVVRCGDKVRLGSLLIHEEEHIGQAGKGKAIWDYVKSGFNYAKNLETGAYSGQLNTLRQLRSQYPSGTQSRASLEAEILRTTTRLNNLNSTGHI